MDAELLRLARWLEAQPWNRPGTDKTWVLKSMGASLELRRAVQRAKRVGSS
jgi:hypothetical protein